ncbi:unnamed protein product [Sympodiomycopsis kandeliae]
MPPPEQSESIDQASCISASVQRGDNGLHSVSAAGPSAHALTSVSAPVSPSASFANLQALRHSLAMRSGTLDIHESAHTFPINDHDTNPISSQSPAPSSSSTPSSPSLSFKRGKTQARARTADHRSSNQGGAASPGGSQSPILGLHPPLPPPLSLRNLPKPRANPSPHHDRRLSPFHESRGMSFTPAATPPATGPSSPNASLHIGSSYTSGEAYHPTVASTSSSVTAVTRRRRSGSAASAVGSNRNSLVSGGSSGSRSASPSDVRSRGLGLTHYAPSGLTGTLSTTSEVPRRSRSRASSAADLAVTSIPTHSNQSAMDSAAEGITSHQSQRRRPHHHHHHRRSSSGIQLALALSPTLRAQRSGDDSNASDTGAEGDEEGNHTAPFPANRLADVARRRPVRTRSSPHLPLQALEAMSRLSNASSQPQETTQSGQRTPLPNQSSAGTSPTSLSRSLPRNSGGDPQTVSQSGLLSSGPNSANGFDLSLLPSHLWQSTQIQDLAGLGVLADSLAMSRGQSSSGTDYLPQLGDLEQSNEYLAPPPPYQASEDAHEDHQAANAAAAARDRASVNLIEFEQAHASLGRRLQSVSESQASEPFLPEHHGQTSHQTAIGGEDEADEILAFRTRRSRDRRAASEHDVSASQQSSGSTMQQQQQGRFGLLPPAWQPKSDTEAETDQAEAGPEADGRDEIGETVGELHSLSSRYRRANGRFGNVGRLQRSSSVPSGQTAASSLSQKIVSEEEEEDLGPPPWLLRWLLHPLRLLAAVPGCVGVFWLMRNAWMHHQLSGSLLKRGPLDPVQPSTTNPFRMTCGLDFILASLWACSTAYHALSLTTLLLRRWLVYYSLFPSLIRLITLQAICWPLVRLTIFVAGPDRPIEAWIVIASFTAFSDVVARWVTSNIADAPSDRRGQKQRAGQQTPADGTTSAHSARRSSGSATQHSRSSGSEQASTQSAPPPRRPRGKLKTGQRFWRAVMGAPFDSSTSESEDDLDDDEDEEEHNARKQNGSRVMNASALEGIGRSGLTYMLRQRIRSLRAATRAARENGAQSTGFQPQSPMSDHAEVMSGIETDYEGETSDAGGMTSTQLEDYDDDEDCDYHPSRGEREDRLRLALRRKRRRHRMRLKMAAISGLSSESSSRRHRGQGGGMFSLFSRKATDETVLLTSGELKVRIRSRRIFHWEVAMKRNVAPIGVLAYLTLWGLLLGG